MVFTEILALSAIFFGGFFFGIKISNMLQSLKEYEF